MSDAIKEIAGVLKDALVTPVQEAFVYRARNPFFGTMVIAWLFYNWNKVAFFFLSDFKIIERIEYIRHKIPDNSVIFGTSIPHTHSFWFPFLWACFISLTFPFFTYASIWVHKKITAHIEIINSGKEIERIRLQKNLMVEMAKNESAKTKQLALEESQIEEHREVTATHKANIESLNAKKSSLNTEIESLSSVHEANQTALSNLNSRVDEKQKEYDDLLAKYDSLAERFSSMEMLALMNQDMKNNISHLEKQNQEYLNEISSSKVQLLGKHKELADKEQLTREQAREIAFKQSELNDMRVKLNSFGDSIVNLAKRFNNIFIVNNKTGEVDIQEHYISALESMNDGNVVTVYPKINNY
jgi:predicted  nucleic acid-binding Zn-ribbon protein